MSTARLARRGILTRDLVSYVGNGSLREGRWRLHAHFHRRTARTPSQIDKKLYHYALLFQFWGRFVHRRRRIPATVAKNA